ncbi:hypothetical protein FB451DRAFT_1231325 [Mycena latifolia]|nr:hypothetical protein FB451DRAFT_1231325 [Mycena latifolia]
MYSALSFALWLCLKTVHALVTNGLIIDDTETPFFTWTGGSSGSNAPWTAVTPATPCSSCPAPPPPTAHNGTYHVGRKGSAGSLTFQGSAVALYGINIKDGANISFVLDGALRTTFYYDGTDMYTYHAALFDVEDLAPRDNHTVSWTVDVGSTGGSLAFFDYAIIAGNAGVLGGSTTMSLTPTQTAQPAISTTTKRLKSGTIAGIVIGVLPLSVILGMIALHTWRRRRRTAYSARGRELDAHPHAIHPFTERASPAFSLAAKESSKSKPQSLAGPHEEDLVWDGSTAFVSCNATDGTTHQTPIPLTPVEEHLKHRLTMLEARVNEQLVPPSYLESPVSE